MSFQPSLFPMFMFSYGQGGAPQTEIQFVSAEVELIMNPNNITVETGITNVALDTYNSNIQLQAAENIDLVIEPINVEIELDDVNIELTND